jgi:hypothetical protein
VPQLSESSYHTEWCSCRSCGVDSPTYWFPLFREVLPIVNATPSAGQSWASGCPWSRGRAPCDRVPGHKALLCTTVRSVSYPCVMKSRTSRNPCSATDRSTDGFADFLTILPTLLIGRCFILSIPATSVHGECCSLLPTELAVSGRLVERGVQQGRHRFKELCSIAGGHRALGARRFGLARHRRMAEPGSRLEIGSQSANATTPCRNVQWSTSVELGWLCNGTAVALLCRYASC